MSVEASSATVAATIAWQWKCRVDSVCERFEDAWRDGEGPTIEGYLNDPAVSTARRAALLSELLKLERELRQARGERPIAAEYLARFPAYAMVIRSIFGEDRVGDYDLIAPIGEGGMGVVYHARHRKIGREVALKMIRPHCLDDAAAIERFRLEAQLAARLEHEHIVTVYEAGQADGHHYYAMRYIVGQSLSEVIGKKPMDEFRAARYLEQVARAVDFAHTHDVLHRDLKPRNILIDGQDRAVVTDFGLAKLLNKGTGATRTDDRLGTPPYMSPEQVRDPSRAGAASDIYSLGATLYEALTGRAPFVGENPLEVYRQILDVEPTPPRHLNRRCGRDLETICLKCLEKDPAGRYASALQLAEDLRRFRDRAPILARRVGPVERLRKLARRHPMAAALVAVSAVAAVALSGVYQYRRTNAILERRDAEARAALDVFTQFGETLSDQPALQKRLFETALPYYLDFLNQHADDPELAEYVASTFTRVARLNNVLGSRPAALKAHQQALRLRRNHVAMNPEDWQPRVDLAETLHDIGVLYRAIGNRDAAIVAYQEALSIRLALVESDPSCRAYLREDNPPTLSPRERAIVGDLARSHGYIGDWEREGGLREAARESYRKAHLLRARLKAGDPEDLLAKFELARSENNAGNFLREDGQLNEAIAAHRRAMDLQQELVNVEPDVVRDRLAATFAASGRTPDVTYDDFRSDLASSYNFQGVLLAAMEGHEGEAIGMHEVAAEKFEALATEHPGVTRWDADRALTATFMGELRASADDLEQGRLQFERLLRTDSTVPRIRAGMARNKFARGVLAARDGKKDEALKLWEEARNEQSGLLREQPRNFDFSLDLERTRRAIEMLGQPGEGAGP